MAVFTKTITLSPAFFGSGTGLKPDSVLALFQDIATDHVDAHGIGKDDLIVQGLLWVVVQTRYEAVGEAIPGEPAVLSTWSMPPRHGMVQREYTIAHPGSAPFIIGTSQWILMDQATRSATLLMDKVLEGFEFETTALFPKRARFLRSFETEDAPFAARPDASAIDFNDHVNNARYADFMYVAAGADFDIRALQIDYHKELRCGDLLNIFVKADGDTVLAEGFNEDDVLVFAGKILKK